jgi:thiamine-phosphate pyrophosphorylase
MTPDLSCARFYGILDTAYVSRGAWRNTCAALIDGGADLVQVRAKRATAAEREVLVRDVQSLFAGERSHPLLIINDDVELCAQTPGAGLHVGQDDLSPLQARARIGADRVLGLSTHSWSQAQAAMSLPAGVLSYFCVGPVFATQTKPDYTPVGLELVRQVAAARPALPWFVIGGITRQNVATVVAAGAERVVIVSDVLTSADPASVIREVTRHLPRVRK